MQTFKYSFLPKIIYRWAVIPGNLILLFYLFISIIAIPQEWKFIFPLIITLILLYVLNRFYFKMYKSFPFLIKINNEKMICSDFVFSKKEFQIKHSDIKNISGSIFSGRAYMPLYIETSDVKVGISPHLKNFNEFLKIILTNVPKELYEEVLAKITKIAEENTPKRKKKKK